MAEKPLSEDTASGGTRPIESGHSVEILAGLDRRQAEALALEVRELARRYGLGPASVAIEIRSNPPGGTGP